MTFPTSREADSRPRRLLSFSGEPLAFSTDEDVEEAGSETAAGSSGLLLDHNSVLDVTHPESPYGLIQEVLPARKKRPPPSPPGGIHGSGGSDPGPHRVDPGEVWLSDGALLVLKGGTTSGEDRFDDPWPPLDDYQAPYREPVLAPSNILETELGRERFSGVAVVVPPPLPTATTTTVTTQQRQQQQQHLSDVSRTPRLGFELPSNTNFVDLSAYSDFHSHNQFQNQVRQSAAPPLPPPSSPRAQGQFTNDGWVPSKISNDGRIDTSSLPRVYPSEAPAVLAFQPPSVPRQRFNRNVVVTNVVGVTADTDNDRDQDAWRRVPIPPPPPPSPPSPVLESNDRILEEGVSNVFHTGKRQHLQQQQHLSSLLSNDNYNFQISSGLRALQQPNQWTNDNYQQRSVDGSGGGGGGGAGVVTNSLFLPTTAKTTRAPLNYDYSFKPSFREPHLQQQQLQQGHLQHVQQQQFNVVGDHPPVQQQVTFHFDHDQTNALKVRLTVHS